jgi:hypothetical protein
MGCTADKEMTSRVEDPKVVGQAILSAFDKYPFSSVEDLTKRMCIPSTMVSRGVINFIGFFIKHLCWPAHILSNARQAARVHISEELLRIVRSVQHPDWQFFASP